MSWPAASSRRDGGQAQFIEAPVPQPHEAARLGPLIDELRAHPGHPYRLEHLAATLGMGLRCFAAVTGTPPGEWLVAKRRRLARDLLEHPGRVWLDDIAVASGFGAQARLRHHFRARLGTRRSAYRRRFAGSETEAALALRDRRRMAVVSVGRNA